MTDALQIAEVVARQRLDRRYEVIAKCGVYNVSAYRKARDAYCAAVEARVRAGCAEEIAALKATLKATLKDYDDRVGELQEKIASTEPTPAIVDAEARLILRHLLDLLRESVPHANAVYHADAPCCNLNSYANRLDAIRDALAARWTP